MEKMKNVYVAPCVEIFVLDHAIMDVIDYSDTPGDPDAKALEPDDDYSSDRNYWED